MDKELPKTWGPVLFEALEKDSIGVIITDCRGVIRYSNPPFSRITGFSQGEVLGRNPKISQSGQTPPETYQSLWMTILHGGTWRGELLNKTKTGDYYWESLTIIPIRDSQNKIAYFAGIIVDITLKKKMEKIRGLSAGAMAHEMKSPLAIIQLAAENLRDALSGPVTEEQKGVLQGILNHCQRLSRLIDSQMVVSKMGFQQNISHIKTADFSKFFTAIVDQYQELADKKGLQLLTIIPPPTKIPFWPDGMNQVFINLLDNALRFARKRIEITSKVNHGDIECGSSMKMSGFNRSVIMSGYENNHPDNERAKQSRHSL